MVDVFGYLKVCVVSGRGFPASSQGLGRLGQHAFAVKITCGQQNWKSALVASRWKSGTVQWNESTQMRCTEGLPQLLEIKLMTEGILRRAEEVASAELDLRPIVATGQATQTVILQKAGKASGEIYLQLHFSSSPQLPRSVSHAASWATQMRDAQATGSAFCKDSLAPDDMFSPLGRGLAGQPSDICRQRPPSAPPRSAESPLGRTEAKASLSPPRHLFSRKFCRSETAPAEASSGKLTEEGKASLEREEGEAGATRSSASGETSSSIPPSSLPASSSGLELAQALSEMNLLERKPSHQPQNNSDGRSWRPGDDSGASSRCEPSGKTAEGRSSSARGSPKSGSGGMSSFGAWMRRPPWQASKRTDGGRASAKEAKEKQSHSFSASRSADRLRACPDLREVAKAKSALGGLVGGERRKTPLELEIIHALSQASCQPSAPPADFSIFAHR